jgi:hypothetical protein
VSGIRLTGEVSTVVTWNQAICEDCWDKRHPERRPVTVKFDMRDREQCCDCGLPTLSGIYLREDPMLVRYPRRVPADDA